MPMRWPIATGSLRQHHVSKLEMRQAAAELEARPERVDGEHVAVSASAPSRVEQLRELGQLLKDGILTQEEFDAEKARILGER